MVTGAGAGTGLDADPGADVVAPGGVVVVVVAPATLGLLAAGAGVTVRGRAVLAA